MKTEDAILNKAKDAKRESKSIEFKEMFNVDQLGDWCEIIKDVAALSNSGGGCILFGVKNNGLPSAMDITPLLNLDPAKMTDKMAKYTGEQFADFEMHGIERNGHQAAALVVLRVSVPMVFILPGEYNSVNFKPKVAFRQGTIYFRHGAKSEPANSKDLRDFIDREVERHRKSWLGNIRKVVKAPAGSQVIVSSTAANEPELLSTAPVRIVDDPKAPAYRITGPDQTYPYRQKEVVSLVSERLGLLGQLKPYDVKCVRKIHNIDSNPRFHYKSKFATPQFSDAFVDWLAEQYKSDPLFFQEAKELVRQSPSQLRLGQEVTSE